MCGLFLPFVRLRSTRTGNRLPLPLATVASGLVGGERGEGCDLDLTGSSMREREACGRLWAAAIASDRTALPWLHLSTNLNLQSRVAGKVLPPIIQKRSDTGEPDATVYFHFEFLMLGTVNVKCSEVFEKLCVKSADVS